MYGGTVDTVGEQDTLFGGVSQVGDFGFFGFTLTLLLPETEFFLLASFNFSLTGFAQTTSITVPLKVVSIQ